MNNTPKWLVRAGSLLVMMAFFLPTVSCTVLSNRMASYSLNDLANLPFQPQSFLYLVLLGALAALAATLIPAGNKAQEFWLLIGQIAGLGLGALSFLLTILSLSGQLSDSGMGMSPDLGFFILLLGYGLAGCGVFLSFTQNKQAAFPGIHQGGPPRPPVDRDYARQDPVPRNTVSGARLELLRDGASSSVPIKGTDFLIGRSHRNDLVLADTVASALHVRLRYAQGTWFIQDQNSSNGTFVNGKRIKAQRLNDGDRIRLGKTTFVFHV